MPRALQRRAGALCALQCTRRPEATCNPPTRRPTLLPSNPPTRRPEATCSARTTRARCHCTRLMDVRLTVPLHLLHRSERDSDDEDVSLNPDLTRTPSRARERRAHRRAALQRANVTSLLVSFFLLCLFASLPLSLFASLPLSVSLSLPPFPSLPYTLCLLPLPPSLSPPYPPSLPYTLCLSASLIPVLLTARSTSQQPSQGIGQPQRREGAREGAARSKVQFQGATGDVGRERRGGGEGDAGGGRRRRPNWLTAIDWLDLHSGCRLMADG